MAYYGYRYYQPDTGRWLSRDPVDEIGFRAVNGEMLGIGRLDGVIESPPVQQSIQGQARISQKDLEEALRESKKRGRFYLEEESNLYHFVFNNPVNSYDRLGLLCVCCFKGRTGKLTVDASCRGTRMWVIDEHGAPASGATSGTTVSADGFVLGGSTYKIDGSTCVTLTCSDGGVTIETCVNLMAGIGGKGAAQVVPAGSFGGPPKEPVPGSVPPPVR